MLRGPEGDNIRMESSFNLPTSTTPPTYKVKPWTPPDTAPDVTLYEELGKAVDGPGEMFNMMRGKHLEDVRDEYESSPAARGVVHHMRDTDDGQRATVTGFEDIPAPLDDDGEPTKWDPTKFAPHYVFDGREDAFPVSPDYDGDSDTGNNGASELDGTGSDNYRDGEIDGQQALNGAFTVSQKGEYTVLTYSNYYATNKGAHYHKNDYSTAQVYLKPDAQGDLQPEFLATSWHYGTQLTPWKDVQKDSTGHPIIQVGLGTHSLQPLGVGQPYPKDGFHIHGDGRATSNGEDIGHKMTYDAFQTNVTNANVLTDPESDRAKARMTTLGYGWTAADPLDPETFFKDNTEKQVEARLESDLNDVEDHDGGDEEAGKALIKGVAEKVGVENPDDYDRSLLGKIGGFFTSL